MDFGWGLAKLAWRLARRSRVLLTLGFAAAIFLGLAAYANLALFAPGSDGPALVLLPLTLLGTVGGLFFQTALTYVADARLDGDSLDWRDALADARWRLGAIFGWALIVAAVALLLAAAVRVPRLGFLVSLAGFGWSFAITLAVPVLALDLAGPVETLREAPRLLRERWGEAFAGLFAIGGLSALAWIPIGLLISLGARHNRLEPGSGTLAVVIGAGLAIVLVPLALTTFQVFTVALHRDATVGLPGAAYVERRPKRKSWVVRIATVLVVGLVALGLVGSIAGPRPAPQYRIDFPASTAAAIDPGTPVIYRGSEIGEVKRTEAAGSAEIVWFTVDSDHRSLQGQTAITLSYFQGRPCLLVYSPGEEPAGGGEVFGGAA
jgi:MFS family permease